MTDTNKPNGGGIERIVKATYCSYLGFKAAFKEEAAFRQELGLTLILFPVSFWLAEGVLHWAGLVVTLLLVLIVEMLNSAIEALTDRVGTERHVLSGRAKDMGSAAVTLALTVVAIVWGASLYLKLL